MTIATYVGSRTIALADFDCPSPGPGLVQLAVDLVGLCGLDRRIYAGELDAVAGRTAVMGHEVAATVVALGSGVTGLALGDPATVLPLVWCNACPSCRAGRVHLCQRLSTLGLQLPGGLQHTWNVPADLVVPTPLSLSPEGVVLVEPAAVAVHALRQATVGEGSYVLVTEGGTVGLLTALFARAAGADVAVVEADRHRRIVALSAEVLTIDPASEAVSEAVRAWTAGAGADVVFEVSGTGESAVHALACVADGGRVVLVGGHQQPAVLDLDRIARAELSVVGASRYRRADFVAAATMLAVDGFPLPLFVSSVEPMTRVAEAFATLDDPGVMRVLVDLRLSAVPPGSSHVPAT